MKNQLFRYLVIPLLLGVIISFVFAFIFPWQGFFVSLSTTFIGILLTVFYVDWILRENEKKLWENVQNRVYKNIIRFANISINGFRTAFNIGPDIYEYIDYDLSDKMIKSMIISSNAWLLKFAPQKILEMNQSDWIILSKNLNSIWEEADRIINLYGGRINPEIFTLIVDIQDKAFSILSIYTALHDILGVPDERLPVYINSKIPLIDVKRHYNKIIINDTQMLLSFAMAIFVDL